MPIERINEWALNSDLPDWARDPGQLWLASLEQQHAALGEQMEQMGVLVE